MTVDPATWPNGDPKPVDAHFFPEAPRGRRFVAERLAAVVDRFPDRPAIGDLDRSISYRELASRVSSEADALMALPTGPVVVMAEDPFEMATGVFAALSADRACCLVHPQTGIEPLRALLQDIDGAVVRRGGSSAHGASLFQVIQPRQGEGSGSVDAQDSDRSASSVVTFFNTSGSTGAPKLVAEHGVLPFGLELRDLDDTRPPEHLISNLSMTGATFSRCVRALLSGDRFTAFGLDGLPPRSLLLRLGEIRPSHFACTPTVLRHLATISLKVQTSISSVRTLRVAGEPLRWADVAAARQLFSASVEVENTYGASEAGRLSVRTIPPDEPVSDGLVPVGRPIPGRHVWIERDDGTPASVGEAGRIVIDGPFSTSGIPLERLAPGQYRLRTSDVGHIDAAGELHVDGRSDRTVKVAGMRVDPAAAEAALLSIPEVRDAAVLPVPVGEGIRLVAHVVVAEGALVDEHRLRAAVAGDLAAIHAPARIIIRSEPFPLLPSGKKDIQALTRSAARHR